MIRIAAGLLAVFAATSGAQADELMPMQAKTLALGAVTGVAYYTIADEGYQVVATLAAGESGTPMRFVATLSAGQKILVSVPQAADQDPMNVEIARLGDAVFVTGPAALTN